MVVILFLVGAVVLACPLVLGMGGSSRSHGRERDRRLRYVAKHPEQVNTGDISRLLSREMSRDEVDLIIDRAQALGVKPWTMLSWMQRFDVHTLAVVIAAELSHEEMLLHLGNGTLPDLGSLEVFAALNGLPASKAAPRPALAAPARSGARALSVPVAPVAPALPSVAAESGPVTSKMPPIFEPGSWPYDQFSDLPAWPDEPTAEPGPLAA